MRNIPPDIVEQIREAICRPEGTVSFEYSSDVLFDPNVSGGILFEIASGAHLFRVERDDELRLSFYHSSPGTGTRVATIDLKNVVPSSKVFLLFSWTPAEINFYVVPRIAGSQLVSAKGIPSPRQFRVGKDGSIFQVGDVGVEVMGSVYIKMASPYFNQLLLTHGKVRLSRSVFSLEVLQKKGTFLMLWYQT